MFITDPAWSYHLALGVRVGGAKWSHVLDDTQHCMVRCVGEIEGDMIRPLHAYHEMSDMLSTLDLL